MQILEFHGSPINLTNSHSSRLGDVFICYIFIFRWICTWCSHFYYSETSPNTRNKYIKGFRIKCDKHWYGRHFWMDIVFLRYSNIKYTSLYLHYKDERQYFFFKKNAFFAFCPENLHIILYSKACTSLEIRQNHLSTWNTFLNIVFHKTTQQIRKNCQYLVSGATWWQAVQPTFRREKYTQNVALHHTVVLNL